MDNKVFSVIDGLEFPLAEVNDVIQLENAYHRVERVELNRLGVVKIEGLGSIRNTKRKSKRVNQKQKQRGF